MVRCSDGSLYTGICKDVKKRVEEHNFDNRLGSRYTMARRPVELAYAEQWNSRSEAAVREHRIKQLLKKEKEELAREWRETEQG